MTPVFVSFLTFVAVLLAVISVTSLVLDLILKDRSNINRRIDEEFHHRSTDKLRKSSLFKDIHKLAEMSGQNPLATRSWRARLERLLEQSGTDWTVNHLAAAVAGCLVVATAAGIVSPLGLFGFALGPIAAPLPLTYLCWKRNHRAELLCSQLPDAYDLMSRALRAGQTIPQAMQGVAEEFSKPIAEEFSLCYEQQNLGLPNEVALRDLARRTGLMEINIFVVAVIVQRQVGGNLAEMLEQLASVVRERYRIRGVIKTLTAEGRFQAIILMALPPLMFLAMLTLNRQYALVLLEYPWLIAAIMISMGIGALWIRRIVNFDF